MERYERTANVVCLIATAGAAGVALMDTAWWFFLGKRGRALHRALEHYFVDELRRLNAALAPATVDEAA